MSNWMVLVILGGVSVILGVAALLNPFPASIAVEQIAAWAFFIFGIVQMFGAYRAENWSGKIWTFLLGVIAVFVSNNLFGAPLAGLMELTYILGIMFIASGVLKIIAGFSIHQTQFKAAVLISGAASFIVGGMIMSGFPASASITLGILLGIELISCGLFSFALGMFQKSGGIARVVSGMVQDA